MARTGITSAQVHSAADALTAIDIYPSIMKVRERLDSTGSPNTIHKFLQSWHEAQPPKKRTEAQLSETLTTALATDIAKQVAAARSESEQAADRFRQEADSLADSGEQLEIERDEALARADELEAERDLASGRADEQAREIAHLRQELREIRESSEQARTELAESRNRVTTVTEQRDETRKALGDSAKRSDTLTSELAEARQALARGEAHVEARSDALARAHADVERQRAELADVRHSLEAERTARTEAEHRATVAEAQRASRKDKSDETPAAGARARRGDKRTRPNA